MVESSADEKRWLVAVDGSDASKEAFNAALEDFFVEKRDHIIVVSVTDEKKTYLPYKQQPLTIMNDYKMELLPKLHPSYYEILLKERKEGRNVHETILEVADDKKADAVFIGYHGRKGPKLDPTIMGQTVKYSVSFTTHPLVIIKRSSLRSKSKTGALTFLVCMDGSSRSFKALEALPIFVRSGDKLVAATVRTPECEEKLKIIQERLLDFGKRTGLKVEHKVIETGKEEEPYGPVVKFINHSDDYYVDFVLFGSLGNRADTLKITEMPVGSFATRVISHATANPIMIP